jgi:hypothetical protein
METTKELRIGNLVEDHNGIRCEIYAIASNSVIVTGLFGSIQRTLGICEIKPIPLTEEWLVKFGFEKKQHSFLIDIENEMDEWCYKTYLELVEAIDEWYCSLQYVDNCCETEHSSPMPNLKSVHQLQNLYFALTGEELA